MTRALALLLLLAQFWCPMHPDALRGPELVSTSEDTPEAGNGPQRGAGGPDGATGSTSASDGWLDTFDPAKLRHDP